jgi:hypothetical protein
LSELRAPRSTSGHGLPTETSCNTVTNASTSRPPGIASPDGYRSRLSDFLNASERDFVSLTDVVLEVIGREGSGTAHEFIAVARRHIVFAMPEDGLQHAAA